MTYQEYWYGDVRAIIDVRKANKLRIERKNQELWLQGMYFYEAMAEISPLLHAFAKKGTKAFPYRSEPYQLDNHLSKQETEEEKQQKVEAERRKAIAYFNSFTTSRKHPEN